MRTLRTIFRYFFPKPTPIDLIGISPDLYERLKVAERHLEQIKKGQSPDVGKLK